MDWSDLRFFLAVARHGTLSGAARVLRVDQSTVSRRLTALEEALGARLMERTPAGYLLTAVGQGVRSSAERIEAEAIDLERRVSGHDVRLEGVVRVTAAETLGSRFVSPLLVEFHRRHPGIELEMITDARPLSLSRREAELAIRMTQPDRNELLVRRLGTIRYALYASPDYLARFGEPDLATGLAGHEVVEYLEETDVVEMRWIRRIAPQARRGLRSTALQAHLAMVLEGGGIGVLPCFLGDGEAGLRRLTDPPWRARSAACGWRSIATCATYPASAPWRTSSHARSGSASRRWKVPRRRRPPPPADGRLQAVRGIGPASGKSISIWPTLPR